MRKVNVKLEEGMCAMLYVLKLMSMMKVLYVLMCM